MRAVTIATAVALTVATMVGAGPSLATPATSTANSAGKSTVVYHGATISFPSTWPVFNLSADPTRCVRFDRHAVYLGHPGADQRCPAHLVGRTTALLVEPYDNRAQVAPAGTDSGSTQRVSANGRALITATYGAGGTTSAGAVLRAIGVRANAPKPLAATGSTAVPPRPSSATPAAVTGHGYGFDTCAAPSKRSMKAWRSAPYKHVGIYIGGINRACGDGNLNSSWVATIHRYGYHLIPTYVGRQPRCSGISPAINNNPTLARTDGRNAAVNAVHNMQRLGFGKGSPIYLDIEHYSGSTTCRRSVLRFIDGWVSRLHSSGYVAGVYSSSLADLMSHHGTPGFHNPNAIWIGRWNGKASVYGDPVVSDKAWRPHKRLHQYRGPHDQRHGGVTINIDTDYVDGPVA